MGWIRGKLDEVRRLKLKVAQGQMISIEQQDGTIKRFPTSALEEALVRNFAFLDAAADGEELPEPTELQLALMNAARSEPWHETFYDFIENPGPVPDLSEPGPEPGSEPGPEG